MRQRTYFVIQEYTMHLKHKNLKLYSLTYMCKNTFPPIILSEETPLVQTLGNLQVVEIFFTFKDKSLSVKASARAFEVIKHLQLIVILMVRNLSINYLNIAWIKTWLTFHYYYPDMTIFYETKFCSATLSAGYHCNTTMNLGLDNGLHRLSLVKLTTCFTELRKHAVKLLSSSSTLNKCCYSSS